jgi:glutaredoxin-like protein NrdH
VVKRYLTERGVPFDLRDVSVDAAAREEFLRRGWRLPPVTVIDGVAVEGFRPERLDELLGE